MKDNDITQEIDKTAAAFQGSVLFNVTVMLVILICASGVVFSGLMVVGKAVGLW